MTNHFGLIITGAIEWTFSLIVALFFYKSAVEKIKKPLSFYKTIAEYRFMKDGMVLKLFTSGLVTSDLVIIIGILIPTLKIHTSILGVLVQIFYLTNMILNYNKSFNLNCGCFSINMPKHIDFKGILLNIAFIFMFISIVILKLD